MTGPSFLATFGLIVSTEPIAKILALRLPLGWARAMSVPVAATIWTLPLQVYVFNVVSPIAIPVNLVAGELLGIVTTVGFFSGLAAVLWPALGSVIARGLGYPMDWMLSGLTWVYERIGRPWFVQQIEVWQVAALYGVMLGLWLWGACAQELAETVQEATGEIRETIPERIRTRRRRTVSAIAGLVLSVAIVALPGVLNGQRGLQIFVLNERSAPLAIVRDRATTVAIGHSDDRETLDFTLLPFFRSLGVNSLALAIDPTSTSTESLDEVTGEPGLSERLTVDRQVDRAELTQSLGMSVSAGQLSVEALDRSGNLLFTSTSQNWLVLYDDSADAIAELRDRWQERNTTIDVLCWSGEDLLPGTWESWQPGTAISTGRVSPATQRELEARSIALWETWRGAIVSEAGIIRRAVGDRQQTDWSL